MHTTSEAAETPESCDLSGWFEFFTSHEPGTGWRRSSRSLRLRLRPRSGSGAVILGRAHLQSRARHLLQNALNSW
jgi:hypothetical protein